MLINICAVAGLPGEPETQISVAGDVVTVDGVANDFSGVSEMQGEAPFIGAITRQGGVIHCTIRVVYSPSTAQSSQPTDPAHWQADVTSGAVPDLVVRR